MRITCKKRGQVDLTRYSLEVEKTGFKKLLQPDVVLHVQDDLAINFQMTLGPSKKLKLLQRNLTRTQNVNTSLRINFRSAIDSMM